MQLTTRRSSQLKDRRVKDHKYKRDARHVALALALARSAGGRAFYLHSFTRTIHDKIRL
jgi:Mor family transcriptional regulator